MIEINNLRVSFGSKDILNTNQPLVLKAGELSLLVGETGSGKSTLLGAIAGLVPHFTGGSLRGQGQLNGSNLFVSGRIPNPLEIGYVFQNPFEGFVQSTVRNEILFSAHQVKSDLLHDNEWLERLTNAIGIQHLMDRSLETLSDGEAQRVAIASALFLKPSLLLLDEPTSALDLENARILRDLLKALVADFEFALIVAEHRYDIWLEHVQQVWFLQNSRVHTFLPSTFALESGLPLLTRDILQELAISSLDWRIEDCRRLINQSEILIPEISPSGINQPVAIEVAGLHVSISEQEILTEINFEITAGSVCSVLGPSGAGKSTLLHALIGDFNLPIDLVKVNGTDPQLLKARDLLGVIALVPQQPGNLFVSESISGECELADRWRNLTPGTTLQFLNRFNFVQDLELHPRDLSAGGQLWLAIAIAIAANPRVLILDEPTRGLDNRGKSLMVELIKSRQLAGLTTVLATHDLELAAGISDQLIYVENGTITSIGAPLATNHPRLAEISATFELLSPRPYLCLEQVRQARATS